MPKVIFSEKADADLDIFIRLHEDSFIRLYINSGIPDMPNILKIYSDGATNLYFTIRNTIADKLSKEKVLGRKLFGKLMELSFHTNNRLIIVLFSEDIGNNQRWIESIFINKKW